MIKKIYNLIVYILRYFEIICKSYDVSSKINFGSTLSNNFYKKNLKNCKIYLEYGSGNSTLLAKKLKKNFISIEADKSFFNYLKYKKKIDEIKYIDIGPTKYFSYPILPFFLIKNKIVKYSNYIKKIVLDKKKIPDLILLDGRYRVYTLINILNYLLTNKINQKITIIIDDYEKRENYKITKKLIKVRVIGRFGVIYYKNYKILPKNVIQKLLNKTIKDYL